MYYGTEDTGMCGGAGMFPDRLPQLKQGLPEYAFSGSLQRCMAWHRRVQQVKLTTCIFAGKGDASLFLGQVRYLGTQVLRNF